MDKNNLLILFFNQFYIIFIILFLYIFEYISLIQIIIGYLILCIYYRLTSETEIYFSKKNQLIVSSLEKCPSIISKNYKPPFFFPINPLQLINLSRSIIKPKEKIKVNREYIGNEGIVLDWIEYEGIETKNKPIFIIFPGLTGGVNDAYVMNITDSAIKNGFNVVIYQMRLLTNKFSLPNNKPQFFLIEDIDFAIDSIRNKFGNNIKIYAIGFSYGSNQLVKYLGEKNYKNKKISAAVSISNPFDFIPCTRYSQDKFYDRILLSFLQRVYKETKNNLLKYDFIKEKSDLIENTLSLNEFDRYYTAKIFGFKTPSEYYRNVSCFNSIKNINIPLLCINALDDQITCKYGIPYDDILLNDFIVLVTTKLGSHICFLENNGFFGVKQWIVKPSIEFVNVFKNLDCVEN